MLHADDEALLASVRAHEGYRRQAYRDSVGVLTIGYGYNVENGMPRPLAELVMRWYVEQALEFLATYSTWFPRLSENRQRALVEMVYQLGASRFVRFVKMIRALEAGDFDQAAAEMLDSQWAQQTPKRAEHCAQLMREG